MMGIRVACLCLVLAYFAYSVASLEWELHSLSSLSIPVFIWSDKQIFSSNNVQVTDTITTKDMEFVLASLMHTTKSQGSKLSASFNDVSGSEVVVLFIEPELRTDQVPSVASAYSSSSSGSFSHLKDALDSAASSMVIPYTSVEEVSLFDETLMDTFESIKEGSIFITRTFGSELFPLLGRLNGVKTVEVDALLAELKSTNAFANGVTDLVVVCFDKATSNEKTSLANHDEIIGSISNSIRAATKGNYVAMYAANMPASTRFVWTFNEPVELSDFQFMLAANNTNNSNSTGSGKINYFPGALIEVYLIVGILITMLFTGGCAIFSLQTPDRWEAPKINKRADL